jgi:hypothetical protein
MAALEQTCARPPTSQAAWVHQIHAAGAVGVNGFTTMVLVLVFGRYFLLFVWFLTCDPSVGLIIPTF